MGAACCCLRDNLEDFADPNCSFYRDCTCLQYFVPNFFHVYTSVAIPPSTQATASLSSTASSHDNSLSEMYCYPPMPLPFDADPRYFRLQQNELVLGRKKGSNHSHEPSQRSDSDDNMELLSTGNNKWDDQLCEGGPIEDYSKSSLKLSTTRPTTGFAHIYPSSEDEDVCPTCLEEYDEDNPRIITKCSHHFHLGCIYEWKERSENCPVCGKVMAFDAMN